MWTEAFLHEIDHNGYVFPQSSTTDFLQWQSHHLGCMIIGQSMGYFQCCLSWLQ